MPKTKVNQMSDHYTKTPFTSHMQSIADTIHGARGTINAMTQARHTGRKQYQTAKEWADIEQGAPRIRKGQHKGPRKYVNGFELVCGKNYVACFATAHSASDLYAWACINGYSASVLWANSPCLHRKNAA